MPNHVGSSLDDWLEEEGLLPTTNAVALKRCMGRAVRAAMQEQSFTVTTLARRAGLSRATVHKLVNPAGHSGVTLKTIARCAVALGKQVRLQLVN